MTGRYVARCWIECPPSVLLDPVDLDSTIEQALRGAQSVWDEDPDTVGRTPGMFWLSVARTPVELADSLLIPDVVLIRAELKEAAS